MSRHVPRKGIVASTNTLIWGLEDRPTLEAQVPYRVESLRTSNDLLRRLEAGRSSLAAGTKETTARIHDLATKLRTMVKANLALAESIFGRAAPEMQELGAKPRKSRGGKKSEPTPEPTAPEPPGAKV